ncbi:MAG TPA: hypothetical protein VK609_01425, partial [Mucilaginibacter sp.]|nr:hypothetical protein [Mucilaginibacter sp.]
MKKQQQHKAAANKQPRIDISTAKDKEEKHDDGKNEARHDYEHSGVFGKNTELTFAALSGVFLAL